MLSVKKVRYNATQLHLYEVQVQEKLTYDDRSEKYLWVVALRTGKSQRKLSGMWIL